MKKKILIPILLVTTIVLMFGCTTTTNNEGDGRVIFAITDAAANMGAVTEIHLTVDSIQVQNSAGVWTTVSSEQKVYNLLELKEQNKTELFADVNVKSGEYNKVRLNISSVTVVDNEGTHDAKMPSGKIDIISQLKVDTNSTSTATFDFIADESLHVTGNGKYIMAPVIHVETRNNTNAQIRSSGQGNASVLINGGQTTSNKRFGMDLNGNVGVGIRVPANIDISVATDIFGNSNISSNAKVVGNVNSDVTGNVNSDVTGNVNSDVTGNVTSNIN